MGLISTGELGSKAPILHTSFMLFRDLRCHFFTGGKTLEGCTKGTDGGQLGRCQSHRQEERPLPERTRLWAVRKCQKGTKSRESDQRKCTKVNDRRWFVKMEILWINVQIYHCFAHLQLASFLFETPLMGVNWQWHSLDVWTIMGIVRFDFTNSKRKLYSKCRRHGITYIPIWMCYHLGWPSQAKFNKVQPYFCIFWI